MPLSFSAQQSLEAYRRWQDHPPQVAEAALSWADPIDALRWALQTLSRVGGYARTGLVPAMPRGDGVPWTERENLALTISAKAHQVTPVPAAWTLRAVAGGPDVEPDAFERAAEALSGHIWRWRGGYCHRGGRGLSASTRRQMARVTLLRLTHATARPTHRRHPPFGWYAKAAKVSRETIYRRHWRPLIQELEDTAEQWRDSGASRLAALLEPLGIIE